MGTTLIFHVILAEGAEAADRPFDPSMFLWVGIIVFLSYFLLMKTRRRIQRSQQFSHLGAKARVDQLRKSDSNQVQVQVEQLMAELADLSRQINGQIDTRLAKLNALLDEADRTIARLEQTMGQPPAGPSTRPAPQSKSRIGSEPTPADNPQQKSKNLTAAKRVPGSQSEPDPQTQAILHMANQGRTAVSIAQHLGRPVGEIELILALKKK